MATLREGQLTFDFPESWVVLKYDESTFFQKRFQSVCGGGVRAMDFVAVEPKVCCWLIEVKDYRRNERTKPSDLADELAEKVFDTLAGLMACQTQASDLTEKTTATKAVRCQALRVVLHLEQPEKPSRLHPRSVDPALVLQKLKQLIKAIDPHPRIASTTWTVPEIQWTVS